jgi:hypothetical protein
MAIDIEDPSNAAVNLLDARARTPMIFRASRVRFEIAFFSGGVFLTDFSNVSLIGIGFKSAANPTGDYLSGPLTVAPNASLTLAAWTAGASGDCHAAVELTPAQTNIGTGQYNAQLVIFCQDSAGNTNPLGATKAAIYESGIIGAAAATPQALRFAAPLQLQAPDTLWYTLGLILGDDGKPTIQISTTGQN